MTRILSALFLATVVVSLILFMAVPTFAQTVSTARCGTRIIQAGSTKSEVLKACGKPTMQTEGRLGTGGSDTWTYNRGTGRFMGVIRFTGGKVSSISRKDYGFAEPTYYQD
jgi:hypothetical protein